MKPVGSIVNHSCNYRNAGF